MHDQPGSRADPLSYQLESSTVVNAFLHCLRATCNPGHLSETRALYQRDYQDYHIHHGESRFPRRDLDFKGSLEQFGLVWLPADMLDWHTLFFKPEIVPLIEFDDNGLRRKFVEFRAQRRLDKSRHSIPLI